MREFVPQSQFDTQAAAQRLAAQGTSDHPTGTHVDGLGCPPSVPVPMSPPSPRKAAVGNPDPETRARVPEALSDSTDPETAPMGGSNCTPSEGGLGGPLVYTRNHERYPLQDAQNAVSRYTLLRTAQRLAPNLPRLRKCHRTPIGTPSVWEREGVARAFYRGLVMCGSVWSCPVCSSRIAIGRAVELQTAIDRHHKMGGYVGMLTLTASHTRDDALGELVFRHANAVQSMFRQWQVRQAIDASGIVGRVTATEITYGQAAGWHPHRHILLFAKSELDTEWLGHVFAEYWQRSCAKHGLEASLERGVDLRGGDAAACYVAKLGLEVAGALGAVGKVGRTSGRYTPWQLLAGSMDGLVWAGNAFTEYGYTMRGKRQLVWSRGLKQSLGIVETTDESLAEMPEMEVDRLLAMFTHALWSGIVRTRVDIRAELAQALKARNLPAVYEILSANGLDGSGLYTPIDSGTITTGEHHG